jgi:hypothetical protein
MVCRCLRIECEWPLVISVQRVGGVGVCKHVSLVSGVLFDQTVYHRANNSLRLVYSEAGKIE